MKDDIRDRFKAAICELVPLMFEADCDKCVVTFWKDGKVFYKSVDWNGRITGEQLEAEREKEFPKTSP